MSEPPKKKRRHTSRGTKFQGNYQKYYSRRAEDDDRLELLRDEWIRGKTVLDIGSNDGTLTLEVARRFGAKSVVGVEIDSRLVKQARAALRRKAVEGQHAGDLGGHAGGDFMPVSCLVVHGPLEAVPTAHVESESSRGQAKAGCGGNTGQEIPVEWPFNVTFRKGDIMDKNSRTTQEVGVYDTVLCLSLTKWIHMAGGDVALKELFGIIFRCLKPGGVLILEPQPEQSYKRARSRGIAQAPGIRLRPEKFCDYLISKDGGFESFVTLRDKKEKGKPFNRPVYAVFKPEVKEKG